MCAEASVVHTYKKHCKLFERSGAVTIIFVPRSKDFLGSSSVENGVSVKNHHVSVNRTLLAFRISLWNLIKGKPSKFERQLRPERPRASSEKTIPLITIWTTTVKTWFTSWRVIVGEKWLVCHVWKVKINRNLTRRERCGTFRRINNRTCVQTKLVHVRASPKFYLVSLLKSLSRLQFFV